MRYRLKKYLIASSVFLLFAGCKESPKEWQFEEIIQLNEIKPLGIVVNEGQMWLTDVDNNRIVKTDMHGNLMKSYPGLRRPMHIALSEGKYYIPEFLGDMITILEGGHFEPLVLNINLDAPAGIDIKDDIKAIVDFYNHRLILINDGQTTIIGKRVGNQC